jgi:uncharacterized protein YodC (DUF2158 family)
MENTIKPGDVVQLKSGGPFMTVTSVSDKVAWCTWFDPETHKLTRDYEFYLLSLRVEE